MRFYLSDPVTDGMWMFLFSLRLLDIGQCQQQQHDGLNNNVENDGVLTGSDEVEVEEYKDEEPNNYIEQFPAYENEKNPGESAIITCYTCHFSRSHGHNQGMKNCDAPFIEAGIPSIQCRGSCAVTNTTISKEEYMVIRSCLPNCKDITEPESSSVTCCGINKCNGQKPRSLVLVTGIGTGSMLLTMAIMCILVCVRK